MDISAMKEQMCRICRMMWQQGWAAANDGNVSARLEDGSFLVTPSGVSKGLMEPEMLLVIDGGGNVVSGAAGYKPSSEIKMHLRCYKEREDIGGAVHAHPPAATGFAAANRALDDYITIEAVLHFGSVPVAPYGSPSTEEIPDSIAPYLAEHNALLLKNHGALTVGRDISEAYYRMETLEQLAKTTLAAVILGGGEEISRENIGRLCELRQNYGLTGKHPGYKKYPEGYR